MVVGTVAVVAGTAAAVALVRTAAGKGNNGVTTGNVHDIPT